MIKFFSHLKFPVFMNEFCKLVVKGEKNKRCSKDQSHDAH